MFHRRHAIMFLSAALIVGAVVLGSASNADQVRTVGKTSQKLLPVKAHAAIQALAKPLAPPVAYGFVQYDGSLYVSSGNVACEWKAGAGRYYIRISGVSYSRGPYIAFVTPEGNGGIYCPATWEDEGALVVCIGDITGASSTQAGFQFVVYKVS
jgi:hypothetical protein